MNNTAINLNNSNDLVTVELSSSVSNIVIPTKTDTQINIFEGVSAEPVNDLFMVLAFFNNQTKLNKLFEKLLINLDSNKYTKLLQVIKVLTESNVKFNNVPLINKIIVEIKDIFSDGKLDVHDIPSIINIMTEVLNVDLSKLSVSIDASIINVLIKLIINVLIELKIIVVYGHSFQSLNLLIDSSIRLLNTSIKIKSGCFSFMCK